MALSHQVPTSLWRSVLTLALPVALQMLLQSFLGMADVIMVGGLGAQAVAAVGLAAKLHFLMLVTMMGVATACAIMVAQYSGARDAWGSQRTLAMALVFGAVFMLPFTLVFCLGHFWLGWINPDATVSALTANFLLITAPVLLITQLITVYEAALRALGNTTVPLVMGAVAALLNIGFNYLLIFGHFGFPELGVAGAAWGTLLARIIQLLLTLAWLYAVRHEFALRLGDFFRALERVELQRFWWFSLPLLVNHAIWALGNAAYHVASGFAGTDALAVMGVMVPIESTFFALFVGLANASSVLVGRSLGGDDSEGAWRLYRFFNRLTLVLVFTFAAALWLLKPWVLGIFSHVDEATTRLLEQTIAVFCIGVWVKVINMLRILGVLRAGGDTRYCLVVDVIVMWVFGVPIYLAAVFFSGYSFAVLYALMYVEDALKWLPIRWRVGRGIWLKNLTRG
ncbi:MATE family efflux transporter [Gilvimarinus algae]|uniref:MATE family efflux transporter n=1 Tax=Gilvimarinus algae TaxID=3058037 RepID=A0ABT8TEX5_9GAMM|nr:MATE family efflux transporter [Gilvimarinus sp. SDUM040014]MDO3381221.1 MATE family efflux transporter [Gilvimarinus sp. SDUM040014]